VDTVQHLWNCDSAVLTSVSAYPLIDVGACAMLTTRRKSHAATAARRPQKRRFQRGLRAGERWQQRATCVCVCVCVAGGRISKTIDRKGGGGEPSPRRVATAGGLKYVKLSAQLK